MQITKEQRLFEQFTLRFAYLPLHIIGIVIGVAISWYLTAKHLELLSGQFEHSSFCSINSYLDCDSVNASEYSETAGIPVSALGLVFYLAIAGLFFWRLIDSTARIKVLLINTLLFALGALFSLELLWHMLVDIKQLCLFCIVLDVVSLTLLTVNLANTIRAKRLLKISWSNFLRAAVFGDQGYGIAMPLLITLVAMGMGSFVGYRANAKASQYEAMSDEQIINRYNSTPQRNLEYREAALVVGSPSAKIKIVEFADFQCPACKRASTYLGLMLSRYKNDVAFYFYNYPLNNRCNPKVPSSFHAVACEAAKAYLCVKASAPERALEMNHALFANQAKLAIDFFPKLAKEEGLEEVAYLACAKDKAIDDRLAADVSYANSIGIEGTPAVFINGREVHEFRNQRYSNTLMQYLLK